jgi:hypothetical protein
MGSYWCTGEARDQERRRMDLDPIDPASGSHRRPRRGRPALNGSNARGVRWMSSFTGSEAQETRSRSTYKTSYGKT